MYIEFGCLTTLCLSTILITISHFHTGYERSWYHANARAQSEVGVSWQVPPAHLWAHAAMLVMEVWFSVCYHEVCVNKRMRLSLSVIRKYAKDMCLIESEIMAAVRQAWKLHRKKNIPRNFFVEFMYWRSLETLVMLFFSIEQTAAALVQMFCQPSSSLTWWAGPCALYM